MQDFSKKRCKLGFVRVGLRGRTRNYSLGSVGDSLLRRIMVFDPDKTGTVVDSRFRYLLGPGAIAKYLWVQTDFAGAINPIRGFYD